MMLKVCFTRLQAAHAFASMAEGMSEVQADDGDQFAADQLAVLAQEVWDNLVEDQRQCMPFSIDVDETGMRFADMVRDNCADNTSGRLFHPDMDGDDADECYVNDCVVVVYQRLRDDLDGGSDEA